MSSLFIFTRDLREYDNLALYSCKWPVIPVFILDPVQISEKNKYFSNSAVQFMIQCVKDISPHVFHGKTVDVIKSIMKQTEIAEIVMSADYTPYAKLRQKKITSLGVPTSFVHNHMMIYDVLKDDGTRYVKYTPYRTAFMLRRVSKPIRRKVHYSSFKPKGTISNLDKFYTPEPEKLPPKPKIITNYGKIRNNLDRETTHLSPWLKFGVVSPRDIWHKTSDQALRGQLIWRDFYMNVMEKQQGEQLRKSPVKWSGNHESFRKWKNGKTGIPLVDAGMNQLNKTGYMHNRARLVVADYLVKHLKIDWRWGEKYFAQKLVDYDWANNNGNWQWVAGTGVDSQPYYRTFNPERQQKKYDPDMFYIKKWNK